MLTVEWHGVRIHVSCHTISFYLLHNHIFVLLAVGEETNRQKYNISVLMQGVFTGS